MKNKFKTVKLIGKTRKPAKAEVSEADFRRKLKEIDKWRKERLEKFCSQFKILSLFLLFLLASISVLAQTTTSNSRQTNLCFVDKEENLRLIQEAESNQYRVRRIEMVGNISTRHRVFVKKMAFVEGDIFTGQLLEKSIKNLSKLKVIYPIGLENVEIRLDSKMKDVDLVFCVEERRKN